MADVFGIGPGSQTTAWAHTFVDRSLQLPAGATITHLALHSAAAVSSRPKIVREISTAQYEIVSDGAAFSHPGGGYQWAPLSYVVPGSGVYRPAWYVSGTVSRSLEPAQRSSAPGDVAGTVGFTADTLGLPPMGYRTQDGGGSPPPSPPPSSSGQRVLMVAGQSGGLPLFGSHKSYIESAFAAMVPNWTAHVIGASVGGSAISAWAPGSAYLNSAITAYNQAIASGASHGALLWDHGENPATNPDEAARIDELDAAIINAFRAGVGKADLPVLVNGLHVNNEASRPYWRFVQDKKRLICEPGYRTHIEGAHYVDVSDLDGTADGVHLTSALNEIKARRHGVMFGLLYMP